MMINVLFFLLIFFHDVAYTQPQSLIATCHISSNTKVSLMLVSSELDFYKFEIDNKNEKLRSAFWEEFLKKQYIVDYNYKFGKEVKTEALSGYYFILNSIDKKSLRLNIHKDHGTKVLFKSLVCEKF